MSADRLAEINENLANPPQFDLSGSDRLGLFIAGQLAKRHDIRITLRESVYGGTTAIVLIPRALVVDESEYEVEQAALGPGPRGSGRHALAHGTSTEFLELPVSAPADGQDTPTPAELTSVTGSFMPAPSMVAPSVFVLDQPAFDQPAFDQPAFDQPAFDQQVPDPARLDYARRADDGQDIAAEYVGASVGNEVNGQVIEPDATDAGEDADGAARGDGRAGAAGRAAAADMATLGLPVRVRQASLAPQLRNPATPAAPQPREEPTPETARNTAAALQRGWQLGRSHSSLGERDSTADGDPSGHEMQDNAIDPGSGEPGYGEHSNG
jgi:hypothetical protein